MKIRKWTQLGSTVSANACVACVKNATIYTGPLKQGCVPFLNCYSCPGALFSCPIGALQVTVAGAGGVDLTAFHTLTERFTAIATSLPLLVIGFLMLVGSFVGRAACGWLCPFGLLQELLNKIPSPKFKGPSFLKYGKYVMLILFVFILPAFWLDDYGMGGPTFCKFICPAGTLEGGLPLIYLQPELKAQLGMLFNWKLSLLILILALAVFFRRPFCRWLCPLGAFYGPFNKVSLLKVKIDKSKCISCHACSRVCPVNLTVPDEVGSPECLHCAECIKVCPKGCIHTLALNKCLSCSPKSKLSEQNP
jgi:ferredoxin-type protein NapH